MVVTDIGILSFTIKKAEAGCPPEADGVIAASGCDVFPAGSSGAQKGKGGCDIRFAYKVVA